MDTVTIPREEYELLKRKAALVDDVDMQVLRSLEDLKAGRVRRVA